MRTCWKFNIRCICSTDKVIKTACSCLYILVKRQQFDFLRPTLRREHYNEEFRSTLRHEHYNEEFRSTLRHEHYNEEFRSTLRHEHYNEEFRSTLRHEHYNVMANFQKIPRLGFICSHSIAASAFSLYVLTQLHSGGTLGGGSTLAGGGIRWWGGGLLDVGYVEGVRREDRSKTAQKPLKSCLKNRSKITARNERFLSGFLSKI